MLSLVRFVRYGVHSVVGLALCISLALAAESKIAYINVQFPSTDASLYVGQNIQVKYSLTLLSGSQIQAAELIDFTTKNNVILKSKDSTWRTDKNGILSNTYIYSITGKNVIIPPLRVSVLSGDGDYKEEVIAQGATFQAIELSQNPNYINVIADSMNVVDYRAKEYDEAHNIVIFQFESKGANLNAMKIGTFTKQGLEQSKVIDGITYGIYYVVLDKSLRALSFDYFNLTTQQFVNINLPIQVIRNTLDDSGDIKPRNTFLMFKNLFIGALIVFVALICFVFKKIRKIGFFALIVLLLILAYNIFFSATSGIAQVGAHVSIIPTHNSTVMEVIQTPTKVAIIGEYEEYYKVMIESKVGWIRKEYVSKN